MFLDKLLWFFEVIQSIRVFS